MYPDTPAVPRWMQEWDDKRLILEHHHAQRAKGLNEAAREWANQVNQEVERRKTLPFQE